MYNKINALQRGVIGGVSDSVAPTITIICSQTSPTATTPLNFTFTISEATSDFAIGDLTVGNGTASNFAGSGTSYTCDITPTAGGAVTVDIAANAFHDSAGNGNAAATQFSITYSPTYAVEFDGTNTYIGIGNDASYKDLQDNAMTVEGYFKITASAAGFQKALIDKVGTTAGTYGWGIGYYTTRVDATVACATTNAFSRYSCTPHDSAWHHWAFTFDDAGDRKIRLFIDGIEVTYTTQTAGVGAIKGDLTFSGGIGSGYDTNYRMQGRVGWVRISNNIRYTGTFTPIARNAPPASDANTIRLFKMNTGTGTQITDSSSNAKHGTMTNGSWVIDP